MQEQFKKYYIAQDWYRMKDQCMSTLTHWVRVPLPFAPNDYPASLNMLARFTLPVGAIIGGALCILVLILSVLHVPVGISAALILVGAAVLSGGKHEEGLADCADGIKGKTPEERLEIMNDSRRGTFGVMALGLSLLVRWQALATLLDESVGLTMAAIFAAAVLSRALALAPFGLLPNVQATESDTLTSPYFYGIIIGGFCVAALFLAPYFSIHGFVLMSACLAALLYGIISLSQRLLGGVMNDVGGATQQLVEIIVLVSVVAFGV